MNKNRKTKSVMCIHLFRQAIFAFTLLIGAVSAVQAEWRFEPVLKVGGEKDDNPTLSVRTDDVLDDTGYLIDLSVRFDYRSPLTKFYVTPRVRSRNYSDHPEELDSDDLYLRSSFSHDTKSSRLSFGLNYDEQSVRQAERAETNLEEGEPFEQGEQVDPIPDDDTGLVRLRGDRQKWRFSPA